MIIPSDQDCNAIVTTLNGDAVNTKASRIWDGDLARFENWFCSAGMTSIFVDHDLQVYGGQCRQVPLGSLGDHHFVLNRRPTRCGREICTPCESDIYTAKWRAGD